MSERMRLSPRLRSALWLFALATAVGASLFGYRYFDDLARGITGTASARAIEEFTGAYAGFALVPFISWMVRRYGLCMRWSMAIPMQILGWAAFSVAHTTLMAVSRSIIFPLAHLGRYYYGNMVYRYPMEAFNDVVVYAVVGGFVVFLERQERARQAELAAADLQRKLAQANLENLRLQLQPHFLFNTLNAISAVMYEDVGKADAMIAKLSAFLRTILASSDAREISLHDELGIERTYVDIMTTRLESALSLETRVDEDAAGSAVPPMLLQPLIENAIQHGRPTGQGSLRVTITASRSNGRVVLHVSDDGIGPPADMRAEGRGLQNVHSRLAQLYDGDCTFDVLAGTSGGTDVRLGFPYRTVEAPT
jgi:two-component system LytT family sensor kinase